MQKFEAPGTLLPVTLTAMAKGAAVAAGIIQNKSRAKRNKQIKMEEDEPRMQPGPRVFQAPRTRTATFQILFHCSTGKNNNNVNKNKNKNKYIINCNWIISINNLINVI